MNTIPIILKCSVINEDYSQLDVDILFVKSKHGFELTVLNCSKDPYMTVYLLTQQPLCNFKDTSSHLGGYIITVCSG